MTTYTGHCHCGQIEWTVKLEKAKAAHILWSDFEIWGCSHCTSCQKLSGGEFTMNQVVPKDDINITKGTLKTYTYKGDSGNDVHCYYCPNCTSHIYRHMEMMGPMYVARTGLLDGGNDFNVEVELYGKDRLHWMPELAKTFEMGPS